jgi:predicted metal-binding membrane protein
LRRGAIPPPDRSIITGSILGVTAIAWTYLLHVAREMSPAGMSSMAAMAGGQWDATEWVLTFVMWAVMMVGMMSPSAAPTFLLYAGTQRRRAHRSAIPATVVAFGLGYIAVWTAFSALAATAQLLAREAALVSPAMRVASPRVAGAILLLAGVYQLTPAKRACLTHCQSPLGFLMGRWRDGIGGAMQMGMRHGLYCLGCCWALMCVLFAVGVMNLAWVAALAAFVLLEKVGRPGMTVARLGGAAMVLAGLFMTVG